MLNKESINQEFKRLTSEDVFDRKAFVNASGGSTGLPVQLLQDEQFYEQTIGHHFLINSWRDADPFDSVIKIWGAERDTFIGRKPFDMVIRDFMRNRITLNCFYMDSATMMRYIDILNRHRPSLIIAYAQSMYEIAKYAFQTGYTVLPQKAIHTGAGTLYGFMREQIESVFQCKVFDHYGTREVGPIASECHAHQGLHVLLENNIVEVIDDDGIQCPAGKEGEIVVTNLQNYSMPLIRYRIGDRGVLSPDQRCDCGCTYPKLQKVTGRSSDVFVTQDNELIMPEYFIHLMGVILYHKNIEQFQVIQKDYDRLCFKLASSTQIPQTLFNQVSDKTKHLMGRECKVEFEIVDKIDKSPTGKYRYTIREIDL